MNKIGNFYTKNTIYSNIRYIDITKIYSINSDEKCSICYTKLKKNDLIRQLRCNHKFHLNCIDIACLYNKNCPICRDVICIPC